MAVLTGAGALNCLEDWENYLNTLDPSHIELGLERVNAVRQVLFQGLTMPPVVLIAGTNGKGSTVALMMASLQVAGFRAGAYTSPHLLDLNERICINSAVIADNDFVRALNAVNDARGGVELTYFEFLTLAAAYYFSVQGVDVALLEVGLGGRLDAVNVFTPCVSLVTNIGLDHTAWLGNSRELIGREKAGVFRGNTPAIYADECPVKSVLEHAQSLPTAIRLYESIATLPPTPNLPEVPDSIKWGAMHALQALPLAIKPTVAACQRGFGVAQLSGRFQTIGYDPLTVLDVAHNAEATLLLAKKLRARPEVKNWVAVFGAYADKDINALLQPLASVIESWVCCPLHSARATSVEVLLKAVSCINKDVYAAESVVGAWEYAAKLANKAPEPTGIIVFGSFETAAAVMAHLKR